MIVEADLEDTPVGYTTPMALSLMHTKFKGSDCPALIFVKAPLRDEIVLVFVNESVRQLRG